MAFIGAILLLPVSLASASVVNDLQNNDGASTESFQDEAEMNAPRHKRQQADAQEKKDAETSTQTGSHVNSSISIGSQGNTSSSIDVDANIETGKEPNVKVNGEELEPDEYGRIRETIRDDDSRIRINVRNSGGTEPSSSNSVSISVESEGNAEEGGSL